MFEQYSDTFILDGLVDTAAVTDQGVCGQQLSALDSGPFWQS